MLARILRAESFRLCVLFATLIVVSLAAGDALMLPGTSDAAGRSAILQGLVIAAAIAMLLGVAAAGFISGLFLRRMDGMVAAAAAIGRGALDEEIPADSSTGEFARLTSSLNAMLNHVAASGMEAQRKSDAFARDLQEPLIRLRHRLERARLETSLQDEALRDGAAQTDAMLATLSNFQMIAEIESARIPLAPVNLKDLLKRVLEVYLPVLEDQGHACAVQLGWEARIAGDRALLLHLFAILIESALDCAAVNAPLTVALKQSAAGIAFTISQDVPALRPDPEGESLQARLDLELATAIARLHGATMTTGTPTQLWAIAFPA